MSTGVTLPKGYKQTEVGVIPKEWEIDSIGNVFHLINGCAFKPADWKEQGIPIIRIQNLNDPNAPFNYCNISIDDRHHVAPGDLLFAWSGTKGTSFGARVWEGPSGVLNQHIFKVITDQRKLLPSYSLLIFKKIQEEIEKQAHGFKSSFVHIKKSDLTKILMPIPSVSEQRDIAAALSDVDGLLAKLDQLIAKKRDLKQATMQQLLTGKTRLSGFSGDWEVKRLGELFMFSGGLSASRDQLSDSGYCYLHYGDIHLSRKAFINVEAEFLDIPKLNIRLGDVNPSSLLKNGDIVFVDASEDDEGTSKHLVVVNHDDRPYISGLHTIVAKSKGNNRLDNVFKRFCFQTQNIKEYFRFFAVGTKVSGISKTNIAKIKLHFPESLEEQTAIATILADMDTEIAALEARRDKTRRLKQGMMQQLLTGAIRLI